MKLLNQKVDIFQALLLQRVPVIVESTVFAVSILLIY